MKKRKAKLCSKCPALADPRAKIHLKPACKICWLEDRKQVAFDKGWMQQHGMIVVMLKEERALLKSSAAA